MKIKNFLFLACVLLGLSSLKAQSDGTLDLSFNPGTGANSTVETIYEQADGKILIGGSFSDVDGTSRNGIARLNTDGSLDSGFDPGGGLLWVSFGDVVRSIAIQNDGKILIGGAFTNYDNNYTERIARLHPDGSFDSTFNAVTGVSGELNVVCIQPDGKILIGGSFTKYASVNRKNLARINPDGSLDTTFNVGTGPNSGTSASSVFDIKVQADGKIIVVGNFLDYNGTTAGHIIRLNSDGSIDPTFNSGTGANVEIQALNLMADERMVISGVFTAFNGTGRFRVARLNSDGSLDMTFVPNYASFNVANYARTNAIQQDGKVLIGGWQFVCRLDTSGDLDTTFNNGVNGPNERVHKVIIQADGRPLIGGWFTSYNGTGRNRIARLNGPFSTGIEETKVSQDGFTIYPNPASGMVTVSSTDKENSAFRITDLNGRTVLEGNLSHSRLDISGLQNGLYFLQIGESYVRLLKQ